MRVVLRKCFVLVIAFIIIVIIGLNLRLQDKWHEANPNINDVQEKSNKNRNGENIYKTDLKNQNDDNTRSILAKQKPWYFAEGQKYPKAAQIDKRIAKLLPSEDLFDDRITNQLMFIPSNYEEIRDSGRLKTILLYSGQWDIDAGRDVFVKNKCPADTCTITHQRDAASTADLIIYKDSFLHTGVSRPPNQLYMLYLLESPYHTSHISSPDVFNWTATYRRDSTIVAPYEKWVYYDPEVKQIQQHRNYAGNKTKKVAWFVSNCKARNGRMDYARELKKHIEVDIFGSCGEHKCPRNNEGKCFEILDRDYKFYLAFENSNCKHYITEKFFVNALNRNILPIVMGARPSDYEHSAPYRSYVHVDEFASPKDLADYLHTLDKNDELYNSYFKWKGTGEFINTFFWCRVCAMLHDKQSTKSWYEDINKWWRAPDICTSSSWRNSQIS